MPTRRVLISFLVALTLGLTIHPTTAFAHGDPIEHALGHWSGVPAWLPFIGATITLALMLILANVTLLRWAYNGRRRLPLGSGVVMQALLAWLLVGFLQNMSSAPLFLVAGYVVLPLAILTVWGFVLHNYGETIRAVLLQQRYLMLAIAVAILYAGFYLWSTNLVGPPEPNERPAPGTPGFLVFFQAYGPLAIWPNVEFWIPQFSLFGAISVGTGMVAATLASLMGISLTLLTYSLARRHTCYRESSLIGGSALVALGTNFCCCCAPAVYPLMAVVLGTTTASSLAVWMIGSSSPFYNLTQVITLALTLMGVALVARRIHAGGLPGGADG